MMVNTVPSYCVSLDILLSECSFPDASPNNTPMDNNSPRSPLKSSRSTKYSRIVSKTSSAISVQIDELIGKKELTKKLLKNIRTPGKSETPPHPKRWLVLAIFCCVSFMQVVVWNTWSPIAAAALYAFPSWTSGTVALFSNWGSLCSVLFIIPTCWMLNEKGLKYGCVIGSSLCTIGSAIRCFTMNELWFTLCAHVGAFMNAIAGVIFGPSVVLLSSLWFPADQRASATGAGTAVSALGMAGSYLLGPMIISLPVPDYQLTFERDKLKQEIQILMYFDFIMHFTILWFIVWLFPETPPIPPTPSSTISLCYKRDFRRSIKKLVTNGNIWLLGLSAALSSGMTGPWLSQLTILFANKNFTSTESARLGFWTIISSCFFSITATRFSDLFQGHIKSILSGLLAFATFMFIWIYNIISSDASHKNFLIVAVISGFSATWASSPLYYELGAEIAYPVPEGMVAGYIMTMSSISCVFVYGVFYLFSETRLFWLNFGLVGYNVGALLMLCFVEEQYNRLSMDIYK